MTRSGSIGACLAVGALLCWCSLAAGAPGTGALYKTDWVPEGAVNPATTALHLRVLSGSCYPNFDEYDPYDHATVALGSSDVVVTTFLRDAFAPPEYICLDAGKMIPVTVQLGEPLGHRTVSDGSTDPPTPRIDAPPFPYPIATYKAPWQRIGPRRVTRRTRRIVIGIRTHSCPPETQFDPLASLKVSRHPRRIVITATLRDSYRDPEPCRQKKMLIRRSVALKGTLGRRVVIDGFSGRRRIRAPRH